MRILLTGGGTGGHFFPLIAVAESIREVIDEERLLDIELYFMSENEYDKKALFDNGIKFISVPSGKLRTYKSGKNITDMVKVAFGCFIATIKMFFLYPDVVFSKGGYASVPALFAARLLKIPVIIHESDSIPGRVNIWSSKFAKRVAICYDEAQSYFPKDKVALTGLPIRKEILEKAQEGMYDFFGFSSELPTIFIIGGSLGAQAINDIVVDALPQLVERYQIIHQTGRVNLEEVRGRATIVLEKSNFKSRYKPIDLLNPLELKMAAGIATVIITRAGSTLFEIANWGIPSIVVPIGREVSRDQYSNAFAYAKSGGAQVIEEGNFTASILLEELERFTSNPTLLDNMKKGAQSVARPDAAKVIARALIEVVLKHQK